MPVVWSDRHASHVPEGEIWLGVHTPGTELPERAVRIRAALEAAGAVVVEAEPHPDESLLAVHDPELLDHLEHAWERWDAAGFPTDPGQDRVVPYIFPTAGMLGGRPPRRATAMSARAGQFAYDTMTLIGPGTWEGARGAADAALTAADLVAGGSPAAYALCRPPGHHVTRTAFGGSCYLANSALAADRLRRSIGGPVAVIDIDAHHGNGTQAIFESDPEVLTASVHVDPAAGWFPHFAGFEDERGTGAGEGANRNVVLAPGSGDAPWLEAIAGLAGWAREGGARALVVPAGSRCRRRRSREPARRHRRRLSRGGPHPRRPRPAHGARPGGRLRPRCDRRARHRDPARLRGLGKGVGLMAKHELHVGCAGWNHDTWKPVLFPDLPKRRWLEGYAQHLDSVEVNSTFYGSPKEKTVEGWIEQVPDDFIFCTKMSRYVTHIKRLADSPAKNFKLSEGVKRFFDAVEPLRAAGRLGPTLWQLPPNFKRDDARLDHALSLLPEGRHAFEFRHESWYAEPVYSALRERDVALVVLDDPELPFAEARDHRLLDLRPIPSRQPRAATATTPTRSLRPGAGASARGALASTFMPTSTTAPPTTRRGTRWPCGLARRRRPEAPIGLRSAGLAGRSHRHRNQLDAPPRR